MSWTPPVGVVDLDLGGTPGGTDLDLGGREQASELSAAITGTTGGASGGVRARVGVPSAMAGTTGGASGVMRTGADPRLLSAVTGATRHAWRDGLPRPLSASGRHRDARPAQGSGCAPWRTAVARRGAAVPGWRSAERASGGGLPVWRGARRCLVDVAAAWRNAPRAAAGTATGWQRYARLGVVGPADHWHDLPREVAARIDRWQGGSRVPGSLVERFRDGRSLRVPCIAVWGDAALVWYLPRPPVPPIPPAPVPWPTDLCLRWEPDGALLVLGRDCQTLIKPRVVPIRRAYLVINDVLLWRVADDAPVPADTLSLSLDSASWVWGFTATLPAYALDLVEPTTEGPVELRARVNGTTWALLAERVSRERTFGSGKISLSGRGHQAVLDAPYAPVQTFANAQPRSAQQLMGDVLTINGVPLGWAIDWGLEDWAVPAGAFSHQGTWITALVAIAQAAGGYLLPDPLEQAFLVRHRYPIVPPWEWNTAPPETLTPDFVLPTAVIHRDATAWNEQPGYTRVYVAGQGQGVLGCVTRSGTDGGILAPMVVDPLITAAAAARQRGLAILGDTGPQLALDLRLPVLPETGVILPGAFVQYNDPDGEPRLGLVRSVSIAAGWPDVWQTIGIETRP